MAAELTDVERVIAWLGRERFDAASAHAWETAAGTGSRPDVSARRADPDDDVVMAPHDLHDVLFGGDDDPLPGADDVRRHRAIFALYRRMPSYALIMPTPVVRHPEVLSLFAEEMGDLLDADDPRLADPVGYHLWCGEFEGDPGTCAPIWAALTGDLAGHPRRLGRLLELSGPVAWSVKRDLLRRLHADPQWRGQVSVALDHARSDVFGSIDEDDVRTWE